MKTSGTGRVASKRVSGQLCHTAYFFILLTASQFFFLLSVILQNVLNEISPLSVAFVTGRL